MPKVENNHIHEPFRETVTAEVSALRLRFEEHRKGISTDWYQTLIDDHFEERGSEVDQDDYFKRRALEEMLIIRYGLHLAETYSPIDELTLPWRMGVDVDDDNVAFTVEEFEGHLLVAICEGCFFDPIPTWFQGVEPLEKAGSLVTDTEFIELCSAGWEEYAHILFESVKPIEVKEKEGEYRGELESVFAQYPELTNDEVEVLYHTSDSEYRGLIWKSKFYRRHVPSLVPDIKLLTAQVESKRRDLRKKELR